MHASRSTIIADVIWTIVALGAINWGLVGFFDWSLVDAVFGAGAVAHTTGARIIYALVGLCGVAGLVFLPLMRIPSRTREAGATA